MAQLETGIQFHLPTYAHVPLPHLVELAQKAGSRGVGQIWVTDNLRSRNSFVVLAALACGIKVKLGSAITVQYFRNSVDLADMVASVSELMFSELGPDVDEALGLLVDEMILAL